MSLEGDAERLVDHLQAEVGDCLRSVVVYTPEAAEVTYLREDLRGAVNLADFDRSIDQSRTLDGLLRNVGDLQGDTLGAPSACITLFEHSVVVVLPRDPELGLVVTLESEIGADLAAFVHRCTAVVDGEAGASDPA